VPFDYESNTSVVVRVLSDANTTTANPDLSGGLTTRVAEIINDDATIVGIKWNQLPSVFVWVDSANEEYSSLGVTGPTNNRKFKTVRYNVLGAYRKEGAHSSHAVAMLELYRLAENIEGVFQREMTLSNTAMIVNPVTTDFLPVGELSGVWVKAVMVKLEARYLFR